MNYYKNNKHRVKDGLNFFILQLIIEVTSNIIHVAIN